MIPFAGGHLEARRWRAFENVTFLSVMESSNDLAKELIDIYFEEEERFPATVLIAETQPGAREGGRLPAAAASISRSSGRLARGSRSP